jgi:hypothetical protein
MTSSVLLELVPVRNPKIGFLAVAEVLGWFYT